MTTHDSSYPLPGRRPARARAFRLASAIALSAVLLNVSPRCRPPPILRSSRLFPPRPPPPPPRVAAPTNADAAKQAWLDAAHRAETYNEQVLAAEAAVTAAQIQARPRRMPSPPHPRPPRSNSQKVTAADQSSRNTRRRSTPSPMPVSGAPGSAISPCCSPRSHPRTISIRRARCNWSPPISRTPWPARSPLARPRTPPGRCPGQSGRRPAGQGRRRSGHRAAVQARAALDTGKAQLDAEIAVYQVAFAQLSTADVDAAVAGAEAANMDAASQARQAEQAAQRDRAGLASDAAPLDTGVEFSAWAAQHAPNIASRDRGRGSVESSGTAVCLGRRGTGQLRLLQPDDVGVGARPV